MSIDSSLFTLIFFCLLNLICGFLCKLLTMIFYNIITIIVWYFSLFYVCQWDKGLDSYTNRVQKTRMIRLRMFSVFYLCIWVFVAVDRINIISVFFFSLFYLFYHSSSVVVVYFNPLSAHPTKWSNTLKQFFG